MSDGIYYLEQLHDSIEDVLPYLSSEIRAKFNSNYNELKTEIEAADEYTGDLEERMRASEEDGLDSDLEDILTVLGQCYRRGFRVEDLSDINASFSSFMARERNTLV